MIPPANVMPLIVKGAKKGDRRKTVTFGDAGEVRTSTLWAIGSVLFVIILWFLSTWILDLTPEWKQYAEEQRSGLAENESYSDKVLLNDCDKHATNPDLFPADLPECSYFLWVSRSFLPPPGDVWDAGKTFFTDGYSDFTAWQHIWGSLSRLLKGLFWGVFVGVPVGLSMGLSSRARGAFDPIVESLRPIPPFALIPLFIIWFGIGEDAKVKLLFFAAVWIMIIAARSGVLAVNTTKVHAAYSLGASKWQILRHVILPNALPEIFTGLRVAIGVCWGTLVAAELLGASFGLGFTIFKARQFFLVDIMLVAVLIISVLGVTMDILMRMAEKRLIPWRGRG